MSSKNNKLVVLWTSGDREVALNMVFMYTLNAKIHSWWEDIIFIVWGPSAKLACEDEEIRKILGNMKDKGVILEACKACADKYGVSPDLEEMGIDVRYMGQPLTDYIKNGYHILTF
ncbi:MAG: DsrE family protein [Candidatus Lokiarchaeota archaeon]|nr:DsrE family protein [Candidatus Lokiarchaeota archaeon]MBD3201208.1 DsrE family protein [Candidatus Lokiarchaeota archaeon]